MAVQVHAHQRPIQPGGDLFDVGRFTGAVIALDHDAAVEGEAGADGDGRLGIEAIGLVDLGHMAVALVEGGHGHVAVHAEGLAQGHAAMRFERQQGIGGGFERGGHGPHLEAPRARLNTRAALGVGYFALRRTSTLLRVALE